MDFWFLGNVTGLFSSFKLQPCKKPDFARDSVVKKINSAFRKELKKVNDLKKSGNTTDYMYVPSLWYVSGTDLSMNEETSDPSNSTTGLGNDNNEVLVSKRAIIYCYIIIAMYYFCLQKKKKSVNIQTLFSCHSTFPSSLK